MASAGTIPSSGPCSRKKPTHMPVVPTWPKFLAGCIRYRQSLDEQLPDAPRTDKPYEKRR